MLRLRRPRSRWPKPRSVARPLCWGIRRLPLPMMASLPCEMPITGDYVQAASGDRTTSSNGPMFVVSRDDLVRIFVDVPETYARYRPARNGCPRAGGGAQRSGYPGHRGENFLESLREDSYPSGGNRSGGQRLRWFAARDVCLYQDPASIAPTFLPCHRRPCWSPGTRPIASFWKTTRPSRRLCFAVSATIAGPRSRR